MGVRDMKKLHYAAGLLLIIGLIYIGYTFFLDEKIKADQEHVIMALGDSLTYGVGDRHEEGYVGQLEKISESESSNKNYKINNYGIPGQESEGVIKQLANPTISEKVNEADYIILFIGTNDLRTSLGGDFQTINQAAIKKGKKDYLDNVDDILKSIRLVDHDVPFIVVGLYNPFPNDDRLDEILDDWNHDLKETVSNYSSITFVPTDDLFQDKTKKDYFSDSLHLNDKGYRLIANRISEEI